MKNRMRDILASKQAMRNRLAESPIDDKVVLLEKLRDRHLVIANSELYRSKRLKSM